MRKLVSILITVLLCLTMLAGCGGGAASVEQKSSGGTTDSKENKKERKTLTVEIFDLASEKQLPIGDNFWTEWIQTEFGDPNNIDVEWMSIPRTEEVSKLNILMSSNDAPDIIYSYEISLVNNYISQGGLADLTQPLDEYGQNLKAFIGEETLSYGRFGGKQYVIPQKRLFPGIVGAQIRKDWLDELNLPVPATHEEFYNTLLAFKNNDMAGDGKTIPFGMALNDMAMGYFSLQYAFKDKLTEEQFYTDNPWVQPGYKEGIRYVNKLYNDGLINSEFSLDKDASQLKAAISNSRVGFYFSNVGQYQAVSSTVFTSLAENDPDAEYVPCDPFENYEGKHPKLAYYPYGHYLMIPAASKVVDEAVQFMDWMSVSENLFTLTSGFEGKNYIIQDGIPVDQPYDGPERLSYDHNNDMCIILNGRDVGNYDDNVKLRAMSYIPYEDFYVDAYNMAITDGIVDPWYFNGMPETSEAEAKYSKTLSDKRTEMFVRLYMCDPSEFDSLYDALVEEYMQIGGKEVMEERKEIYIRLMK